MYHFIKHNNTDHFGIWSWITRPFGYTSKLCIVEVDGKSIKAQAAIVDLPTDSTSKAQHFVSHSVETPSMTEAHFDMSKWGQGVFSTQSA